MSEIELIKLATEKRKKLKKKADNFFSLSSKGETQLSSFGTFPILTEGVVVDGKGKPKFAIAKNTLQRMYDELSEDFEGLIKLSHQSYSDMPVFLGKFKKEDLSVVDYEDGRKQLMCEINLFSESPLVQQLMLQDNPVGFSIEGYFDYDGDEKLLSDYTFDVFNKLNLLNLSIVGQSADVMVGDVENFKPKGEIKKMGIIAEMKKLFDSTSDEKLKKELSQLSEKSNEPKNTDDEILELKATIEELEEKINAVVEENTQLKEQIVEKDIEIKMAEDIFSKFEGLKKLSTKDIDNKKDEKSGSLFTGNAFE